MRKTRFFTLIIGLLVLATSCGSVKTMQKNHNSVRYQISPNPLEVHGDQVVITINGNIPEKYFQKDAVVYLQPVLTWETGEVILSPMNLKGVKVEGNGKAIDKKTGGRFVYKDTVAYRLGMENATLTLNPIAYKSKAVNEANATWAEALENEKALYLGNIKLGTGINATSNRVDIRGDLGIAPHNYVASTSQLMSANIYFTVNLANLNWNNPQNIKNDAKRSVDNMISYIANNNVPRQIFVNAWASPEGEESFNIGLSKKRAETTYNLVNKILDDALTERAKVENVKKTDLSKYIQDAKKDVVITTNAKGEDWDNFIRLVEGSSLKEKNTVVNVVKSQPDKIRREQEIRNMSVVFSQIEEEILPILRRGEIAFNFSGVQKTDQEIAKMATLSPDDLTYDELMYAASLTHNYATKYKIYTSVTERFGSEWAGWNNAGAIGITLNQLDESKRFLEVADKLSPENPAIQNNLALLHLAFKDVKTADMYMKKAVELGSEQAMVNQAIVEIKKGNYEEAAKMLDGRKCIYNLALLQLLTGNTGNAIRTLDCCMDQTAEVNYLRAVCYARLDDVPGLIKNLREACKQEPEYKYKAKNDLEFRRYISNLDFQNIVNN